MSPAATSWPTLAAAWAALPAVDYKTAPKEAWKARDEAMRALRDEAVAFVRQHPDAFWKWFLSLTHEERKNGSLVANVLWKWTGPVPKHALAALIKAGVDETCPSFNRTFIEPAVRTYGTDAVAEALLHWLEHGTLSEKAGAANALYWARVRPKAPEDYEREAALLEREAAKLSPESAKQLNRQVAARRNAAEQMRKDGAPERSAPNPSEETKARERCVCLREFVHSESVEVRRSILGKLCLDPDKYPEDMRALVPRAIEIARGSDDAYLRHRVEIQLGRGGPLMALPDRSPE